MRILKRLKRLGRLAVLTVIPSLTASVLMLSPASAATAATQRNVPRHTSTVSPRAVPGLYHCATSATCDIVNANMHFTNYSSVCIYQNCNFASAADWEKVVLGIDPSVATLKSEYANAGQTFGGGLNMSQLWRYWRSKGVDGAIATKIVPYARNKTNTERAVSNFGALIVTDVSNKSAYIGTTRYGAGTAIMVIDGFDPRGPLVVIQAKTLQMTWVQWNAQSRGMWGITASTNATPPVIPVIPTTPSTSTVAFNANGGSGTMPSETETIGTTAALTVNTFTDSGYTFTGWNTASNGSGVIYANGATYSFATSTTLYAQWTVSAPTTATIIFNANGGVGTMAPETESLNVSAAVTTNTFTQTGYTFTGWNTASNGSGTSFTDGELVTFAASATFYAQWTAVPTSTSFVGQSSPNWSGYVLPTSTIVTYASGEWTVPILNCADTPNSDSATWVGTGNNGGTSGTLLQTGTNDGCVNGVQQDSAWWEKYPMTPNYGQGFVNLPISPGDSISAQVYQATSGQWVTAVQDLTTGLQGIMETGNSWYVTTIANNTIIGGVQGSTTSLSYSGGYTAEWIVEDPGNVSSSGLTPFANYGAVTFTNLMTSLPSGWSLPNGDGIEIVDSNGTPLSVPSPISGDGFTVNYSGP